MTTTDNNNKDKRTYECDKNKNTCSHWTWTCWSMGSTLNARWYPPPFGSDYWRPTLPILRCHVHVKHSLWYNMSSSQYLLGLPRLFLPCIDQNRTDFISLPSCIRHVGLGLLLPVTECSHVHIVPCCCSFRSRRHVLWHSASDVNLLSLPSQPPYEKCSQPFDSTL